MTFPDNLKEDERVAVKELRRRLDGALLSDIYIDEVLLRFLKARNYDLDKSEIMLRKNIKWRKSFQVDNILRDFTPREFFPKYQMPSFMGFDKKENIVIYFPVGKLEAKEMVKCVKSTDFLRNFIWWSEKIILMSLKQKKKTGRISQISVIIDLDKLSLINATSKLSIQLACCVAQMFYDNYPDCMQSAYVINAPSYFSFIFSILMKMVTPETREKVNLYGQEGWTEKLVEVIDPDVLPAFLGGKRTDPDGNPLCLTSVSHGGVPLEMYHLPKEDRYFKDKTTVMRITVRQRRMEEICLDVTELNSLIQWEFLVHGKDIGFGLFLRESDNEVTEILPIQIFSTVDGTEACFYRPRRVGEYIIVFDNSHSWITSKEVEYDIKIKTKTKRIEE